MKQLNIEVLLKIIAQDEQERKERNALETAEELKEYNLAKYEQKKRAFERAYILNGSEGCGAELYALAYSMACSSFRNALDPRRKTDAKNGGSFAPVVNKGEIADSGCNQKIIALSNEVREDMKRIVYALLNDEQAEKLSINKNGVYRSKVLDKDAKNACTMYATERHSDGLNIVHASAEKLLELAKEYRLADFDVESANAWLDSIVTHKKLARTVYYEYGAEPEYEDEEEAVATFAHRATSAEVRKERAVSYDPTSKYLYIETYKQDEETGEWDEVDTILYRFGRFAGIGGEDNSCTRVHSASIEIVELFNQFIREAKLTDREISIASCYVFENEDKNDYLSQEEIARRYGITVSHVENVTADIRKKAKALGYTSKTYERRCKKEQEEAEKRKEYRIVQIDANTGERIAVYTSVCEASKATKINKGNISQCISHRSNRQIAGGYWWKAEAIESAESERVERNYTVKVEVNIPQGLKRCNARSGNRSEIVNRAMRSTFK